MKAVSCDEVEDLIRQNKVSGGMILKLEACKRALSAGVNEVRIVAAVPTRAACFPRPTEKRARDARDAELSCGSRSGPLKRRQDETTRKREQARSKRCAWRARYLMNTYRRPPIVFVRGRGCYLYDHRGRKYLDFLGGMAVNALGTRTRESRG